MHGRPDRHGGRAGDLTAPEPLTAPEARIGTERHHEALTLAADPTRFADGTSLGVDEHIWHHVGTRPIAAGGCGPKALTGMVDPTPDQQGRVLARLLNLVPGRSGQAYTDWLGERGARFRPGVMWKADRTATASFQLGSGAVDECRRRVQQDPRAPRSQGRRLYGMQNLLRAGAEKLTDSCVSTVEVGHRPHLGATRVLACGITPFACGRRLFGLGADARLDGLPG